jgi:hypothetical protein
VLALTVIVVGPRGAIFRSLRTEKCSDSDIGFDRLRRTVQSRRGSQLNPLPGNRHGGIDAKNLFIALAKLGMREHNLERIRKSPNNAELKSPTDRARHSRPIAVF